MSRSKKAFLALLGTLVAVIAAGVGVFYLFDKQLVTMNHDISKLKAEQTAAQSQINSYEATKKKVEELAFVRQLAFEVLPGEKEQANTVAELKKFVIDAGMIFEALTFTGESSAIGGGGSSQTQAADGINGVRVLPASIQIAAGATYEQVLSLLQKIETNQRKMQVTELTLVPDETGTKFSTITINVDIYLKAGS